MTYKLRSGIEVAAKIYEGEPSPLMYVNRTGAQKAAAKLGPGWTVYRGMGRPFYAARADQFREEGGEMKNRRMQELAPTDGFTSGERRETVAERAAGMAETFGLLATPPPAVRGG